MGYIAGRHQRFGDPFCLPSPGYAGGEEEMWHELSYPMRKRNDVVVPILIVHGREDLREFFVN